VSRNLLLLASYPKSGNTWVRLFIEALRQGGSVSINSVAPALYGPQRRRLFDAVAPVSASELPPDELEEQWPDFYRLVADEAAAPFLIKVHERLRRTPFGHWLFPPDCVKAAIYLVRHPFDVAVSYAHHRGDDVATVADLMGDPDHWAPEGSTRSVAEHIGDWSGHVRSWLDEAPFPTLVVRYEDLLAEPTRHFRSIAEAIGLEASDQALELAIAAVRFDRLQEQERDEGFRERPEVSPAFFRSGHADGWKAVLDEGVRRRLITDHGAMMDRLAYPYPRT
jgi:aryl sulfotransferase